MDSKIVNKEIKKTIKPFLQAVGFTKFSERNAWRYRDEFIEVINFQSFNSYLADGVGCTTYSFAINLGVYFKWKERIPLFGHLEQARNSEYFAV